MRPMQSHYTCTQCIHVYTLCFLLYMYMYGLVVCTLVCIIYMLCVALFLPCVYVYSIYIQ